MNIYYVLNSRFPTIKAHGLQVAKTCQGMVEAGHNPVLIVPKRKQYHQIKDKNPFELYSIHKKFKIIYLPSLDMVGWGIEGKLSFAVQQFLFGLFAAGYLVFRKGPVYSRDQFALYILSWFRDDLFWEVHRLPENMHTYAYTRLLKKAKGIVVISQGLKNKMMQEGLSEDKIIIGRDGIDMDEFQVNDSLEECRKRLSLPFDKKIIMYVGHLFEWKGVDTLIRAAAFLDNDSVIVVVGGTHNDIEKIKKINFPKDKVIFCGFQEHSLTPLYMKAADVLVIPNIKDGGISEYYTSPLKLFEYMATEKPIIASDLPSLREIVNDSSVFFFTPGDVQSLANQIHRVLEDPDAHHKAANALASLKEYTWAKRGSLIMHFIKEKILT